jgi:hypothetical protein
MGSEVLLSIAFLRKEMASERQHFIDQGWDIIIEGDGNFLAVTQILKYISGSDFYSDF